MKKIFLSLLLVWSAKATPASAHNIYFCGEVIPTERGFVADKLMNVIRNQIPSTTLSYLRFQAQRYFPAISAWLKYYGIPDDFKYIPIIECGFRNLTSGVGARGFWQLMPEVATSLGLSIYPYDQRDDPTLSTRAACALIRQHYAILQRNLGHASWVLTAACYNFGPGNVLNTVRKQGSDYFNMQLNAETAEYVYRLIAVKELFEHPELYMNGFGQNIFSKENLTQDTAVAGINKLERGPAHSTENNDDFKGLDLHVAKEGGQPAIKTKTFFVPAKIVSDGNKFHDGELMTFELMSDLRLTDAFRKKGTRIKGKGWLIDGRVMVDLGYGADVEVQDETQTKGLTPEQAAEDEQFVLLKTEVESDD